MQTAALLLSLFTFIPTPTQQTASPTLFGITSFPYDTTLDAVQTVRRIVTDNSTLAAIHLDNGIPWRQMLDGSPIPASITREWREIAAAIQNGRPVYVGLAPLDTDRKSLAPALGETGRLPLPAELQHAELDDPSVSKAYLRYAQAVVRQFQPKFLNLGIEAGEIMSRDISRWPKFVKLYRSVYEPLKKQYPEMQIGISFGLGELRSKTEQEAAHQILDICDYVGLSFYPYASAFDEKFGAPPYASPAPWREPLAWIRRYTYKPIAICETGYTSRDIAIPQYNLKMNGDATAQASYVLDLFETARKDNYLFVVWYLAVDYDKLYAKMPAESDAMLLWRNIGLFNGNGEPKPAFTAWQKGLSGATSGAPK